MIYKQLFRWHAPVRGELHERTTYMKRTVGSLLVRNVLHLLSMGMLMQTASSIAKACLHHQNH